MRPINLTIKKTKELMNVSAEAEAAPILAEVGVLDVSWDIAPTELDYRDVQQNAYRIIIYRNGANVYDTDRVDGITTHCRITNPPERLTDADALVLTLTLWDGDNFLTKTAEVDL